MKHTITLTVARFSFRLTWRAVLLCSALLPAPLASLHICVAGAAEERPNVLWITGEDMSAKWPGCHGNKQIKTPNFDKFASEGFLSPRCFANAPVCARSRSGWIMDIHPISTGTICMRSQHETPASLVWSGGTSDLDLAAAKGTFTVKWFNPRTGGPLRPVTPASLRGGAQTTLTAPDQEDWLAVVGKP